MEKKMERIEVRYSPVLGYKDVYHKSILYHRADGVIVVSNAGPARGASPSRDGWGPLQSWEEYLTTPALVADFNAKYPNIRTEVILQGENLSPVFDRMMDSGQDINSLARSYSLVGPNSNSAADQKLRDAGAPSLQYDTRRKYRSPGSGLPISPAPPPPNDAPLSDGPSVPPPIDGGPNREMPTNGGRTKRGAPDQIRAADTADGRTGDRFGAGTVAASDVGRTLVLSNFGMAKIPGPDRDAPFDRMAEIKTLMGNRHSEYWRGPEADALQQEYRDLAEASEQGRTFGESIALSPEAASTLIGSAINAHAQPGVSDNAPTPRMAELQTLMADQHSDYWRGPKADLLQQEYRDLIELRDRRKRRERELFPQDDIGVA